MTASQILDASLNTETAHFEGQRVLCVSTYASSTANPFKKQQSDGERLVHKREANCEESKGGQRTRQQYVKKRRQAHAYRKDGGGARNMWRGSKGLLDT